MKYLKTNLEGKVRNLPHFKGEALLPVFEAVVNSIQAIEELGNLAFGEIDVRVVREAQGILGGIDESRITGFIITDNGIGFNDANYDSFETSDSIHKQALGGKGVGRFLWLKAFESVDIESVYATNEQPMKRKFTFTTKGGIHEDDHARTSDGVKTVVGLRGFKKEYQSLPSAYKTTAKIAQRIMEHCLSYFISGMAPRITVCDQNERLVINDIFDRDIKNNITIETVRIEEQQFSLAHIKLYATHESGQISSHSLRLMKTRLRVLFQFSNLRNRSEPSSTKTRHVSFTDTFGRSKRTRKSGSQTDAILMSGKRLAFTATQFAI